MVCVVVLIGSCADIMHSAVPFRNGFKETVIAIILRDVVRGLDYLHNMGYIHRWALTCVRFVCSASYDICYIYMYNNTLVCQ